MTAKPSQTSSGIYTIAFDVNDNLYVSAYPGNSADYEYSVLRYSASAPTDTDGTWVTCDYHKNTSGVLCIAIDSNRNIFAYKNAGGHMAVGVNTGGFNWSWHDLENLDTDGGPAMTLGGPVNAGGAEGDPHITTMSGKTYDLDVKGPFRLFGNEDIVVNGHSSNGDYVIWKDMDYIRKLYIKDKNSQKWALINTGFRGKKAHVSLSYKDEYRCDKCDYKTTDKVRLNRHEFFNNNHKMMPFDSNTQNKNTKNDDNFKITIKDLPMDKNSKRFCTECRYRSRYDDKCKSHEDSTNHKMLRRVRNVVSIEIRTFKNSYYCDIYNVNHENFEPCKVLFRMGDMRKIDECEGAIAKIPENIDENLFSIENIYSDSVSEQTIQHNRTLLQEQNAL